jgi:hypothetical protein
VHEARPDAPGAGVYPHDGAFNHDADALNIGEGLLLGLVVRVADIVADQPFLFAVKATSRHKTSENLEQKARC